MKKLRIYLLIIAAMFIMTDSKAAFVSPQQALERATKTEFAHNRGINKLAPKFICETKAPTEISSLYVFSYSGDNGFLILPADDRAYPILAYSDNSIFDKDNIAPGAQYWIDYYTQQIANLPEDAPDSDDSEEDPWSPVEPLVVTKWSQSSPYNMYCPKDNMNQAPTGCGATAMAQVMNYWQYPYVGRGSISYKSFKFNTELSIDFSKTYFDWDNMLEKYFPDAVESDQTRAVATLMKACGYSVQMYYEAAMSNSDMVDFPDAFINYFKYDKTAKFVERTNTTLVKWEELVYNELAAGRPLVFAGFSADINGSGHLFVCDGYASGRMFHMNFGWSGMSDGYYRLNAVNPIMVGVGGMTGDYNARQVMIAGVQPPEGTLEATSLTLDDTEMDIKKPLYLHVKSLTDIPVSIGVRGKSGMVTKPIYARVYDEDNHICVFDGVVTDSLRITENQERTLTGSFTIPYEGVRVPYSVVFYHPYGKSEQRLLTIELALEADPEDTPDPEPDINGVTSIYSNGLYNVYTCQGMLIKSKANPEYIQSLPPGIYIINNRKVIVK